MDAYTGAPLQASLGLFQCQKCKVFYQSHSMEVIRSENSGQCVACLSKNILYVSILHEARGRNADVSVVTMANYRQHLGHVATFEELVYTILQSRRGTDYAVMFENARWTRGFKMVVFKGDVSKIGGSSLLYQLVGKTVRVRGLLVNHNRYGYQIIVSESGMILSVK